MPKRNSPFKEDDEPPYKKRRVLTSSIIVHSPSRLSSPMRSSKEHGLSFELFLPPGLPAPRERFVTARFSVELSEIPTGDRDEPFPYVKAVHPVSGLGAEEEKAIRDEIRRYETQIAHVVSSWGKTVATVEEKPKQDVPHVSIAELEKELEALMEQSEALRLVNKTSTC